MCSYQSLEELTPIYVYERKIYPLRVNHVDIAGRTGRDFRSTEKERHMLPIYQILSSRLSDANLKDVDIYWDTALHIASRQGNLCIVKFLVEEWTAKNCVEVCNFDGKTALHEAAQFSQPHVVRYLIKQGAEVNALKRADWTPLMLACTKVGPDALEIVNILLGNGAKPQLHNKDGWTALHIASREGDVNIVSAVLNADCSLIKLGSRNGRTPLHTAALHGQDSVVALLLKHIKDSVDISDSCGLSPLLEAVRSGNINLVQHFINSGASLNHVDAMGLSSKCKQYFLEHANEKLTFFRENSCTNRVSDRAISVDNGRNPPFPPNVCTKFSMNGALDLCTRLPAPFSSTGVVVCSDIVVYSLPLRYLQFLLIK
uniref:Ankyrin repeat domain-containing protein 16 n=1 Tax=Timema bartmani TaxID=61472 RepID=A0A7R9I3K3_9NEOP|nr:unnamed protein product [Timema bartmani]